MVTVPSILPHMLYHINFKTFVKVLNVVQLSTPPAAVLPITSSYMQRMKTILYPSAPYFRAYPHQANLSSCSCIFFPLPSARQHLSYRDCLEVKREYYQNFSVLDCVTQCSQSAAHLCEQFLQVQQIGFVTLGPLRCAQRRLPRVVLL